MRLRDSSSVRSAMLTSRPSERLRGNLQQAFGAVAENKLRLGSAHGVVIVDRAPVAVKRQLVAAALVYVCLPVLRKSRHGRHADDECGHKPQTCALHLSSTSLRVTLETPTSPIEILAEGRNRAKGKGAEERRGRGDARQASRICFSSAPRLPCPLTLSGRVSNAALR